MPKLKSRSKRVGRVERSRKSRTSARKYVSKEERGLGECRGKKKNVCKSDPNCSYRKKIGCVRKRGSKGEPLVYGPALPNAKYKRRVGRPSGRSKRSKSRSRKRVGRPRKSKSKSISKSRSRKRVGRPRKSKSKSRSRKRVGRPRKSKSKKSKSRSKRRVGRPRKSKSKKSKSRSRRKTDGCGDWGDDDGCGDWSDDGCGEDW